MCYLRKDRTRKAVKKKISGYQGLRERRMNRQSTEDCYVSENTPNGTAMMDDAIYTI